MADQLLYFLLADGSLFTYMKELNRRLTDKEAMNFFIQVLIAVCYLHSLGIIHKDLKGKISYQRCSVWYLIVIIVVVVIIVIIIIVVVVIIVITIITLLLIIFIIILLAGVYAETLLLPNVSMQSIISQRFHLIMFPLPG